MKLLGAAIAFPSLIVAGLLGLVLTSTSAGCGADGISVNVAELPSSVGEYSGEQIANAATILNAGASLGVTVEAQAIALMVAITESDLRNIGADDAPEGALGLFQQPNANLWGTAADRLSPTQSSLNFYEALSGVNGWEELTPTLAANAVQGAADPYRYEDAADDAAAFLSVFGAEISTCQAGPAGQVNSQGWASPVDGVVGSPYGPREGICTNGFCTGAFHNGQDFEAPVNTPIYAVGGGTVSAAGPNASFGNWIVIDHGGGLASVYAHMYGDGVFVKTGDTVRAGQNIGAVGCSGVCTGPHLHFEIRVNGERIDPMPFLRQVGLGE